MGGTTPKERAARALDKWLGASLDSHETAAGEALTAAAEDREGLARVLAEAMPCTWSIPNEGHPYDDGCVHRRGGGGRGACWDLPWELTVVVREWLTGGGA